MANKFPAVSLALCLSAVTPAWAEDDPIPDWNTSTLSGDWGGLRKTLFSKGVDVGATHKSDVLSDVSGGVRRGTAWLGHTEARLTIDMEKLLGWEATTAYIHYHSDLGSKFNTHYVGGFMGVDNIEVATNTAQFYHAWIQKNFMQDSLSVLAGLYPIDSEFYVTETSGLFLEPPYGMSSELGQTGKNGPPIFPMGALGVRVKYTTPGKNFYVQGAISDGVPGDPDHRAHAKSGEGTLLIMELGYTPKQVPAVNENGKPEESEIYNKTAIGFWHYTDKFDDLTEKDALGNPLKRRSQGAYFLAERSLMVEKEHPSQGLSGFVRFGVASEDVHQCDWSSSAGLRYHGLIPGRDDDIAGIAVTVNHTSDKYRRANDTERHETDWEMSYRAQVNGWLAVQPDVQYIVNPGMDKSLKNAWVVGFRTEIAF